MERVHLAKFLFIFIFAVFIIRSTSLAIFPGEILSKPNKIISNSIKNPLPEIYDRNDKLFKQTCGRFSPGDWKQQLPGKRNCKGKFHNLDWL